MAPDAHAGPVPARQVVEALWHGLGLAPEALERLSLAGAEPVLPSSFAVGTAAQAGIAAAALAATEVGRQRNGRVQQVAVDMRAAACECCGALRIDGRAPDLWEPLSGLYRGAGGWLRLHANFAHHRDAALRALGLPAGTETARAAVEAAVRERDAPALEDAVIAAGGVAAAVREFAAWQAHAQGRAVAARPLPTIERLGDAAPPALPPLPRDAPPLAGLRVLDLTRILAGPVGTRTLAFHGADVLRVAAPQLPEIAALPDTSRGKLSALADLRRPADRAAFDAVLGAADIVVQGYRPGAFAALGYDAAALAERCAGGIVVTLSAYGPDGPWGRRRGFDSLVQAASGFNLDEGRAFGAETPRALPMQILDYASGHLITAGALAAWLRQRTEGGRWHVQVALAATGHWLRGLGRVPEGVHLPAPNLEPHLVAEPSGFGRLQVLRHAAHLSATPVHARRPAMPPGSHALAWPAR